MYFGIGRRSLIGASAAYALGAGRAFSGQRRQAAVTPSGPLVAASSTVSSFAWQLMSCQDHDPQPWYDELIEYVGLNYGHRALPAVSPATERRQAVFFARVAITKIIPFYLQYAGLRHLAVGLAFPTDLLSAGRAAHDLIDAFLHEEQSETEEGGWHPSVPPRHRAAYCAALHSGTACFIAMHEKYHDDAGRWCGMALTSAFLDAENPVSREEFDCSPLWDIALSAIIQAQGLDANDLG